MPSVDLPSKTSLCNIGTVSMLSIALMIKTTSGCSPNGNIITASKNVNPWQGFG